MDSSELQTGVLIEGPKWPEPVEIKKADRLADGVEIVGTMMPSGRYVGAILSEEELSLIALKRIDCDFASDPREVFLAVEAIRYRFASMYDPLLAMSTSKVHPLPHQIEAVYGRVLKMPRIRFLLAHDPGAGKTIMAGLIIKEMKLRHLATRILIVVPGHLKDQWRRELKDKFEEKFSIADRGTTDALYGESVWHKESQLITSIDFAKRENILASLRSASFDLVIVDEAHKMAAYKYGEKISKTSRYKLGEVLSSKSEHLLLLTATPHKGNDENFRLFLDLLEPGFFATTEMLKESLKRGENSMFLRQIKEDMKHFDGRPLFMPRNVATNIYNLSGEERDLYTMLTTYVRNQFGKALSPDKKRNIGFALIQLQRRLASSSYALWRSLQRRKTRLSLMLTDFEKSSRPTVKTFDFDELDDMSEEDRWEQEKIWETLSIAENRDELKREIQTLGELEDAAKKVIDDKQEVKLGELQKIMAEMDRRGRKEKILIFTESRDTLGYLEKRVKSWGYETSTIHGGMKLDERIMAEGVFKNKSRVMIATEAAGEGINLQFCHLMINYDIPWNPNRLEQRMGRIHRYGQKYEVFVHNLITKDTVEGRIFKRLFEKLDEIKNAMGNDRVYDIMGEIYHDKSIDQMIADAATGARTEKEVLKDMEIIVDADYIKRIREDLTYTLATKNIDLVWLEDVREKARENRLMPEYTSGFFIEAFTCAGGKVRNRQDKMHAIDTIPYPLKNIAREDIFRKSFGHVNTPYNKITFDSASNAKDHDAEFLTFGHPLFESVLEWVSRKFTASLQRGSVFTDKSGRLDGTILFFEGSINDGTGRVAGKRLFSYYMDSTSKEAEPIPPTILWDLEGATNAKAGLVDVNLQKATVLNGVVSLLREYQEELLTERNRQAEIKQKYGIRSLEKLIRDHDADLVNLRNRQNAGENVDIAIRSKEERQRKYMDSKQRLSILIAREKNLTVNTPIFLGMIRVVPTDAVTDTMRENSESEQISMDAAMQFEKSHGRTPTDVSNMIGLGYDIKSTGNGETRYIEVKGRHGVGQVALTKNEWFKAMHLADRYYLYVVWNTKNVPAVDIKPRIIQDPAHKIHPATDVHYLIDVEAIRGLTE